MFAADTDQLGCIAVRLLLRLALGNLACWTAWKIGRAFFLVNVIVGSVGNSGSGFVRVLLAVSDCCPNGFLIELRRTRLFSGLTFGGKF